MATIDDDDVIQIEGQHYIRVPSARTDDRTHVLNHDDTFGVFDRFGDVRAGGLGEQGLFHCGTRHLSRLELRIANVRPLLLSSTVNDANDILTVDLTNPDISGSSGGDILIKRGELHVLRSRFLWQGVCHERLRVGNFATRPIDLGLRLLFDADFVDIFEVRGATRPRRGARREPRVDGDRCVLSYQGLDGVVRQTSLWFQPPPDELTATSARFDLRLEAQRSVTIELGIGCHTDAPSTPARTHTRPPGKALAFGEAQQQLGDSVRQMRARHARVDTSNEQLGAWLRRSVADLDMMTASLSTGLYPYAGVPWFSTVFGRDGIITAFETLWCEPSLARGVLAYLAENQATKSDPTQEAEPGKILHETRGGEMAALGEVPFGRYYGSVDATPLFVMLAGAYLERTDDSAFIETLWPNVERALGWMDGPGDRDGDGFIEYQARNEHGLVQQGWKDSSDSVFHADGNIAPPPIALCEVQAYAYGARRAAAEIARVLGKTDVADRLDARAEELRAAFDRAFWCADIGTYALALDGHKRPCRVRASNAGHCLWAGIALPERAGEVARTLLTDAGASGWGIRTVASTEARYNPMSYHNGSIWPHDNALIAAGFSRYGLMVDVLRTFSALLGASTFLEQRRLPELYCGFDRRPGEGPTLYPVACLPQAWAAGSVFLLLQALLGLRVRARRGEVLFDTPVLPEGIDELRVRGLTVGSASVDLLLERHPHDVGITVLRRSGEVRTTVTK